MTDSPSLPGFLKPFSCPCCGSRRTGQVIASQPEAETLPWDSLKASWYGFFKKKVFLTYKRCSDCGLLYAPAYFTDEALAELYADMPDNGAGVEQAHLVRTQRGYFDFLARHTDFSGNFFELGPDIGLFTQNLASRPNVGHLWLYEPNVAVHAELSQRVGPLAHTIRPEMTDFSAVPDNSVSTCVLIHVLDHLPDAEGLLRKVRSKLKPGARLMVVTHDERSLLARLLGARWPAFCLQHSQLYNVDSTRRFLAMCGFRVIETEKSTNHFPASYLLKHGLYAAGLTGLAKRLKGGSFALPLRLGNIATVAEPDDRI